MSVDRSNYSSVCLNYCTGNFEDIEKSTRVVCLFCKKELLKKLPKRELEIYEVVYKNWCFDWIQDKSRRTAWCPKCNTDALIGNKTTTWTREEVEYWHKEGFCT